MKLKSVLVLGFVLLTAMGCSKDEEVLSFCSQVEGLSKDIVKAVESNEDKSKGVDEALKVLKEQGPGIKSAYAELQEVREFQVKQETIAKMTEVVGTSVTDVMSVKIQLVAATMKDEALSKKVDELMDGYQALFQ